ncbi:MFS transporter [Williamsia sterculiae]|uniref:Drug resistance transporter, EmrB/QacA subfamily n=1 Tax=Williamsia sterculiae TaxID=1344003 RepID=A0A1N7H1I2_9NOCA|nr:MFS transporter [Williamsia sterculiae]SIS18676.1 drug resistance transporter, EmrB/QacA subfamily [Williamsia sterculiae]
MTGSERSTTTRTSSPRPTTDASSTRSRENSVLAVVCACTVLVVGFVASINLAVPELAASGLHPSSTELLWIVDAYVVLFACLVIPAGAAGDRWGRKGALTLGMLVFGVGALLSAIAPDVTVMLVGRVISGVGAAAVLPSGLAVVVHAVGAKRRPRAIAVWAAMSGVGGVVGNVGGGVLLQIGSWRWMFAAVVPAAVLSAGLVASVASRSPRHERKIAPPAVALLTLGTLALLVGVIQGPVDGWTSPTVTDAFAASALMFVCWTVYELRSAEPLLDPRVFRTSAVATACVGMLVVFFGMFGFFFLNASLLQYSREFTALEAGLGIVPMTVPLIVGARAVPRLVHRVGDRIVLGSAFVAISGGLAGVASAIHQPYVVYAAWLVVMGIGMTLALPTLTIAISAALPPRHAGVAGGLQATTRELGSALGVAVMGTILTAGFDHRLAGGTHRTVAQALSASPTMHTAVVDAYTASARTSILTLAAIVTVTGALLLTATALGNRTGSGDAHAR